MSLKDRIAALQLREDRDRDRATSPGPVSPSVPHAAVTLPPSASADALRAKIAQFESKGAVPAPRGSFGMGAPPESAPKRRAELYGNRMQPARIPSAGLARPSEAFSSLDPRAIALPPDSGTGYDSVPTSPLLSPSSSSSAFPSLNSNAQPLASTRNPVQARSTAFSTALDIARKAEADVRRERRNSAHWLTPQHTGGPPSLVPQYTGDGERRERRNSAHWLLSPQHTGGAPPMLVPQYTGGPLSLVPGSLTPQHTGSASASFGGRVTPQLTGSSASALSPQLTGSSSSGLTPQLTGGPLISQDTGSSSPPLSPLVSYASFGAVKEEGVVAGGAGLKEEEEEEAKEEELKEEDEEIPAEQRVIPQIPPSNRIPRTLTAD
ncbi:hypothetical protein C8R47DRAFT_582435 [Mycena vitilis]|nr:hypothetical protein C8R47DRAFT_582435 [Mycena vitilis]